MGDWPGTTEIETLMIPVCWTEFYIKLGKDCRPDIDLDEKENYTGLQKSAPRPMAPNWNKKYFW